MDKAEGGKGMRMRTQMKLWQDPPEINAAERRAAKAARERWYSPAGKAPAWYKERARKELEK